MFGPDTTVAVPLPRTKAEITPEWMTLALGIRHPGIVVTNVRLEDVYAGASALFRAYVEYDDDAAGVEAGLPNTLIVKGGFREHSDMLAHVNRIEARFYAELQPWITMRTPVCHYTGMELGHYQSVLILEDLDRRGVTWLRYTSERQAFDVVAARLRALATYHAGTWASPKFEPGGEWEWVPERYGTWVMDYVAATLEPAAWAVQMASPQGMACSLRLHDGAWLYQAILKLRDRDLAHPQCLLHGDAHMGNTYLEADGTPGFYDVAVCRGHWSNDVAYSLCTNVDMADRPQWEGPLIAIYLDQLRADGVDAPSFEDAYHEYACTLAFGFWCFAMNDTDFQTASVNTAGAARHAAAAIHNNTIERLS